MRRAGPPADNRQGNVRDEAAPAHRSSKQGREARGLQTRDTDPSQLTRTAIQTEIEALPDAGWLRLHKVARALCRHTGVDPDDLLQEAFQRALGGSRRCPRHIDVVAFLAGVMRSIASDWCKARRRRPEVSLTAPTGGVDGVVVRVLDRRPDPLESLAGEQEAASMHQAVIELFADDPVPRTLVAGILDGLRGDELRSLASLSETEFASKRRLIRRRIDKAFPKELKP
jgi:RNA polymerase sigma-70 factor (ECF subfamily)